MNSRTKQTLHTDASCMAVVGSRHDGIVALNLRASPDPESELLSSQPVFPASPPSNLVKMRIKGKDTNHAELQ